MTQRIFIDTSIWISLVDSRETRHPEILGLFTKWARQGNQLYTSNDVIDETVTRLLYSAGIHIAKQYLQLTQEAVELGRLNQLWTNEQCQKKALKLVVKYADKKLSLTDATSIVLFKDFKLDYIATLDQDFQHVGMPIIP